MFRLAAEASLTFRSMYLINFVNTQQLVPSSKSKTKAWRPSRVSNISRAEETADNLLLPIDAT